MEEKDKDGRAGPGERGVTCFREWRGPGGGLNLASDRIEIRPGKLGAQSSKLQRSNVQYIADNSVAYSHTLPSNPLNPSQCLPISTLSASALPIFAQFILCLLPENHGRNNGPTLLLQPSLPSYLNSPAVLLSQNQPLLLIPKTPPLPRRQDTLSSPAAPAASASPSQKPSPPTTFAAPSSPAPRLQPP